MLFEFLDDIIGSLEVPFVVVDFGQLIDFSLAFIEQLVIGLVIQRIGIQFSNRIVKIFVTQFHLLLLGFFTSDLEF